MSAMGTFTKSRCAVRQSAFEKSSRLRTATEMGKIGQERTTE
jgi:hypothetical protein